MDLPLPYRLPLSEGIYDVEVLSVVERSEEGDFGPRYDVIVAHAGKERLIVASETLYLRMYPYLVENVTQFRILVAGQGRDVRYSVSPLARPKEA